MARRKTNLVHLICSNVAVAVAVEKRKTLFERIAPCVHELKHLLEPEDDRARVLVQKVDKLFKDHDTIVVEVKTLHQRLPPAARDVVARSL